MTRLDVELVSRDLVRSRTLAARLIKEGKVRVAGSVVTKPSTPVDAHTPITAEQEPWVSRGAYKLLGGLDDLDVTVPPLVLDAGASTGGFTQVVLDRGAERVFAIDVGHGQMAPQLAEDPRVVMREGLNLRDLTLDDLDGQPVDLVVGDVSFISLTMLLEPLSVATHDASQMLLLVKPQFEVGRKDLGARGVVTDPMLQARAVDTVVSQASALGWTLMGTAPSRITGQDGNREFFVHVMRST
ncbi:MAG: TlyA family RNA methyltransferase [Cutibacterium granulosum]|uniref:TlyA family RNA methyltransferase n=1 Tax=Cutibacterium granulosum TaxID=33011 RepID=UPI002B225056|nr:TlyA family RNA methyltransferase [Cutibacterium granulosum]MEA5649030.1 TlyA family RNA methyltransferase [Cutibacterium granulosum]MEA5653288.1 TlyA family RNA methyltransferase [Cutibacterium granulosum]MEA5663555.1 TlyA family RNA methyltransferase [Cutibacterium granulosum]MEA5664769.1 TlyA family RNA methyltransferase [Cutibacterium granulosum]